MTDSARLRRHLHIIRCLDAPFTYPSLQKIVVYLIDHDIEKVSEGTFVRDLSDIRADYNITITYNRKNRGYFIDFAEDENVDDFRAFVRLLERRERLAALTAAGPGLRRYIHFEQHDGFRGLDLLAPLHTALQRQLVVTFQYQPYGGAVSCRRVEPGLLFEYRNRWYLDGFDLEPGKGQRTFGLDRISDLVLTAQAISTNRKIDYRAARRHVIGVTAPPDALPQRVVLRFIRPEAEYVRSLPIHPSQQIIRETPETLDVALFVVLNHELQREILAFGNFVTVLEPSGLRDGITRRVTTLGHLYG